MSNKDYTKFSKQPVKTEEVPVVEKKVEVEEVAPIVEMKIGVVTDCAKLNVREEPDAEAEVLCVIEADTELMIDETESTREFYKVCTATGVEGYCMKKFIDIEA